MNRMSAEPPARAFETILIANRGEIAVRVIRSARALGYRTVAVHSDVEADAPHVLLADAAMAIGPAPVGESYLNIARILAAAERSGAQAVHPGYGFLSENAEFVRACEGAGLVFIGPSAEAAELMGNKAAAKRRMAAAGVPCVPGYEGDDQSDAAFMAAAASLGFPVMIKAAAGGGGRGMRLVSAGDDMAAALNAARSEARNAFASDELILETAVPDPRHVEIQVFADRHGNVIHLGERDCSVQRRHQKVIEEAPCPVLSADLRARMGAAAVEAARSIGYRGAGTVEFLLDADSAFYFLEMNTRLQVEHPVTEMITGLDLVAMQIAVAAGEPLALSQDDVRLDGHAIEARLYAEEPARDFLPATGTVAVWNPAEGEGVRIDAGIRAGLAVSHHYDPMLAKLIAWGADRETARRRLIDALKRTALFGVASNKEFLIDLLEHPRFAAGNATTGLIGEAFPPEILTPPRPDANEAAMAAVLQFRHERGAAFAASINVTPALLDWHSGGDLQTRYVYEFDDLAFDLLVTPNRDDRYRVRHGEDIIEVRVLDNTNGQARLDVDGRRHVVLHATPKPGVIELAFEGRDIAFRNRIAVPAGGERARGDGRIVAPMHGTLAEMLVGPGDAVAVGTRLAVLEAMKMQHDIIAQVDGTVRQVLAAAGAQVAADDVLIELDTGDGEERKG